MKRSGSASRFVSLMVLLNLLSSYPYAFAAGESLGDLAKIGPARTLTRAEEFYSEQVPGEILISVHLLGAVAKSGVYHVPKNTDLVHLIALAGGTRPDADLSKVSIKRRNQKNEKVLAINLARIADKTEAHSPLLESGDLVLVQMKEPLLERDTVSAITVVTSLLSVIASAFIVTRALR